MKTGRDDRDRTCNAVYPKHGPYHLATSRDLRQQGSPRHMLGSDPLLEGGHNRNPPSKREPSSSHADGGGCSPQRHLALHRNYVPLIAERPRRSRTRRDPVKVIAATRRAKTFFRVLPLHYPGIRLGRGQELNLVYVLLMDVVLARHSPRWALSGSNRVLSLFRRAL